MVGTVGWLLASTLFLLRFRGLGLVIVGAVDAAIVLTVVFALVVARPRMLLRVSQGELVLSRLRGQRRIIGVSEKGRVVELEVDYGAPDKTSWRSRIWMIIGADDTVVLRLNQAAWDHDDLDHVRTALSLPLDVRLAPVPAAEARASYPGLVSAWSVSWWINHPTKAAILIVAALMCIALAIRAA